MFQRAHSLATLIKHESDGEALRLSTLNQMPLMNLRVVKLQMRISEFKIEDESDPDNYQGALNKQMKGKRMSLDPNRKAFLENAFQMQPFPNRKDRELLAKKTGMTSVQVRIWVCIS